MAALAMEWNKLTYAGQSELVRVIRARVTSSQRDVTFNIRLQYDNASDLLGCLVDCVALGPTAISLWQ